MVGTRVRAVPDIRGYKHYPLVEGICGVALEGALGIGSIHMLAFVVQIVPASYYLFSDIVMLH